MPPKTDTLAPFNHPMHIANTIAKRQRELVAALTAIEGLPHGKKAARVRAYQIFTIAMAEIEARIRATS